jgi:predicted cytidylate kinase
MLAERLECDYVYTGDIFRELAKKRGMSLTDFSDYAEHHPEIDSELDERQLELARSGDLILEGRVAGWITWKNGVKAFKVWLDADLEVRAERVCRREDKDKETVIWEIKEREDSEHARYQTLYNFDLTDTSFYNLTINTGPLTPEQISDQIINELKESGGEW